MNQSFMFFPGSHIPNTLVYITWEIKSSIWHMDVGVALLLHTFIFFLYAIYKLILYSPLCYEGTSFGPS